MKCITTRIKAIEEESGPNVWQEVQNGIEKIVSSLERGERGGQEGGVVPATGAAAATSAAGEATDNNSNTGSSSSNTSSSSEYDNIGFALHAEPILREWHFWWLVQRIGPTATLTNEVSLRVDPIYYTEKKMKNLQSQR